MNTYLYFLIAMGIWIAFEAIAFILIFTVYRKGAQIFFIVLSAVTMIVSAVTLIIYMNIIPLGERLPSDFYGSKATLPLIFALIVVASCSFGAAFSRLTSIKKPKAIMSEEKHKDEGCEKTVCVRIKDCRMHGEYKIAEK